ncbi:MAG: hypothetical protein NCW75_13050 [Phycisphaera sp.]|nr:MAG: hypothetical protein NCW75_13050 [Phycisphaera sp.]
MPMVKFRRPWRSSVGCRVAVATLGCLTLALGGSGQVQDGQPTQDQPRGEPPAQDAQDRGSGRPLFIDDAHEPTIMISWIQRDGTRVELARTLPWGTSNDRVDLGLNVLAFAAVGGTRIELGRGHPLGAVVRVGFYREDVEKPFFADIKPGSSVEVRLQGVRFLEDARPTRSTALNHLQYHLDDLRECGLDASAVDQYNTARADENLGGAITKNNGRPGVIRVVQGELPADAPRYYRQGSDPEGDEPPQPAERFATVRFSLNQETGAIGLRAELPYELFRHVSDPWLRTEPGTFFEPTHFHIEFESLPLRAYPGGIAEPDEDEPEDQPEVVGP